MIVQLSNPFGGPASFSADNAPAVNGSLPHPSVMAGAINSELRRPPGSQTVVALCSSAATVTNSNPDSFIPSVRHPAAALVMSAPLFSSCRVRDANSFMRR